MKKNYDQLIEQALQQAFREEQSEAPQEQPALSPDFRERMLALNRQHLRRSAKHTVPFRSWMAAAAAVAVICAASLSVPALHARYKQWRRYYGTCPEVAYTISQMPENCTQICRESNAYMSYTQWTSPAGDIVLMQEEASLNQLMDGTRYHKQPVTTDRLQGMLYCGEDRMVLVWQDGKYFFLLMMDGSLSDAAQIVQTAESLKTI